MTPLELCILLAVILVVPPLVAAVRGTDRDWLGVPVIFVFMMLLAYVAPAYDVVHESDLFFLRYPGELVAVDVAVSHALAVACAGALAFQTAWYWPRPRVVVANSSVRWRVSAMWLGAFVYTACGLALFAAGVVIIGGPSALLSGLGDRIRLMQGLNYLFQAVNLLPIVALVWWMWLLTTGRPLLSLPFWLFVGLAVTGTALQGSKSLLFIFIVMLAVLYHRMRRRIPAWLGVVGAVLLFVALTFYALTAREYFAVGEFVTVAGLLDPLSMWNAIRAEFLGNFIQLQTLTVLVEHVPRDVPLQWGRTYGSLFTMPIPHGIWPDKPLPSTGVFTLAFWPQSWLDQGTTIPPGIFGEMYLNFGLAGVIAGGSVMGRVGRRVQLRHLSDPHEPRRAYVYALFVAMLAHYIRGDFAVTVTLLILLLPAMVLLRFSLRESPSRGAARHGQPVPAGAASGVLSSPGIPDSP